MADISGYIRIINEAEKGEAVRDAITGALEEMNTYGGNASTLENHPASYFATATFFTAVAEQVGEVDDVLIAIENGLNALKYDMGEFTLSGSGGTFTVDCTGIKGYDNLDVSKFYFEILGGSDATQAGSWTPTQSYNPETGIFSYSWGALSSNINVRLWIVKPTHTTVGVQVQPLVITENGNWDAGANAAYNPVTIRVPNVIDVRKLTQSITKNGVFTFTPEPNTGFSEVTLHVEVPMPREKVIVNQTFTENGTYRAIDEEPVAADGYGIVTVNVDQKIIADEKTITANGTYDSIDEGLDGYEKVIVDVPNVEADLGMKTISENGVYDAEDDDLDGYDTVRVYVPEKELHEKTITENGIYDPTTEIPAYDGYSKVRVFVSGGGSYPVQSVKYLFSYNRYNYEFFPMVLSMFGTSEVTDFQYLFESNTVNDGDIDLTGLDTSAATKLRNLFDSSKCDTLTFDSHIFDGPLSEGNPVQEMFSGSTIGKVIFGACKFPKSSGYMFRYASISEIEMRGSDLSDIGNNNDIYSNEEMFYGVSGDFIAMVNGCVGQIFYQIKRSLFYRAAFSNLKGQLTGGKTFGKVKSADYMFQDYRGNLDNFDPTIFDYSECTGMYQMFNGINSATGNVREIDFSGVTADVCTDIRQLLNNSNSVYSIVLDGASFAIARSAESLFSGTGARVFKVRNLNIPSVTDIRYWFYSCERARFIDLYGITVGAATLSSVNEFVNGTGEYVYWFLKSFTADVGLGTATISLNDTERDVIKLGGVDDGFNYINYLCLNEEVTITNVVFSYADKTLTVSYNNTGSSISTQLIVEPRCHMYLPKSLDCSRVTVKTSMLFWASPRRASMDVYTDATKAEAESLGWAAKACNALGVNFNFEVNHATFLALPEVTYPTVLRYGKFLIHQEAFEYSPTYSISQDGKVLTVEFDVDSDVKVAGIVFFITSGTTVKFESTTPGYKQYGTCGIGSYLPRIEESGRDRGSWQAANAGSAANWSVTKDNYNPAFFASATSNNSATAVTITYTLTITD